MAFAHDRYPRNEKNPDELATPNPGSILNLGKGASGKPGVPLLRAYIVLCLKIPSRPPADRRIERPPTGTRGAPKAPPLALPAPRKENASRRSASRSAGFVMRGRLSAIFITNRSRDPWGSRSPRRHAPCPLFRSASFALGNIGAAHRCWSASQFQMLNFGWSAARI